MQSAQSTFQDSAESLRDILTDAMYQELKTNIGRGMDQPERKPDQAVKYTQTSGLHSYKEIECQTSNECQPEPTVNGGPRLYRVYNQFGTPLQLSVVQPSRIQRSGVENGVGPNMTRVTHQGVNTPPMVGQMPTATNEAVRAALLQVSEAKARIASLTRENDEVNELLKSTQHDLEHCRDFLKEYEKRNAYLEKENRTLLLQLRSLLSQNQGVVTEALENNECHYREKLALRDELETINRYKDRLEQRLLEHYKNSSSPKKVKPTISFLQKARDALIKDKEVYKLDNSRFVAENTIEPEIKQVDLLSAPKSNAEDDGDFDDRYLKDFQNFINNLEKRQMSLSPTCIETPIYEAKSSSRPPSINSAPLPRRCFSEQHGRNMRNGSSTDSEYTDKSSLSLRLQLSPHFPVTDRSEEDRIEAYTPNSIVPSQRKSILGKTSSLTNFSAQDRNSFMESRTNGGVNLQKTQSVSAHRRRVPSANEKPAASTLGGLIGRRKVTSSDSTYLNPVTSFSQPRTGTLTRRQQHQQEPQIDRKSQMELAKSIENPECLAKPVVFLEYGDL
nr:girdin [Hymenolepis microstoma]